MEGDGKINLRTYIERLFEERTDAILRQLQSLDDKVMRERTHMDEIMRIHIETHANEHAINMSSMNRSEESTLRRLEEMHRTLEKLADDSSRFVRRDTVDERFIYMNEQMSKIEQRVSALQSDLHSIASTKDAHVWVLGIVFTIITLGTSIVSIFMQ
jgi:tRNA U55 pseudouridine synthase TruB